jgi:activator of HSP90 ATPase
MIQTSPHWPLELVRRMMTDYPLRATLSRIPTRREAILSTGAAFASISIAAGGSWRADADEVSHSDESIHEELSFRASPEAVYEALTDTAKFEKMTREIQAREGGNNSSAHPTEISREVGGAFTLFGGRIVGRHLELLPNQRIVQAWRVAYWEPGIFSIVRFDLLQHGADTKLTFSHAAFPKGDAANLVNGWKLHYWQPLEKFLGNSPGKD